MLHIYMYIYIYIYIHTKGNLSIVFMYKIRGAAGQHPQNPSQRPSQRPSHEEYIVFVHNILYSYIYIYTLDIYYYLYLDISLYIYTYIYIYGRFAFCGSIKNLRGTHVGVFTSRPVIPSTPWPSL